MNFLIPLLFYLFLCKKRTTFFLAVNRKRLNLSNKGVYYRHIKNIFHALIFFYISYLLLFIDYVLFINNQFSIIIKYVFCFSISFSFSFFYYLKFAYYYLFFFFL